MGCVSSSPANAAANFRAPTSRAAGVYETKRPQLQHDSLSLAAAALAGVPPRTADDDSTSSSSGSISETGYSSEDDMASNSSLGTDQGILAGMAHSHGLEHAMVPPGSHHRPPMSSVKTTYKLRVGVLEGTTFLNQYIVVDTLGRGSFGKVKLCLHTGDDTLYAVKVVNTRALRAGAKSRLQSLTMLGQSRRGRNGGASAWDGAADAAGTGTFGSGSQAGATPSSPTCNLRREVEVMRSLSHPNLVRLFEVIEDSQGGKVLMVMEYCEAGALVGPGALSPDRHLPEPMAQYYFRQMAAGLAYLHQNHVVHGDVKPENVMLSGNGTVKIGDFGQSQFFDRRDTLSRTLGTPAYLAPEVCAGESYRGRQADVWALGVSLYLFMYGDMPFKGDSVLELYDAVVEQEVRYPAGGPISFELQDLFMRLLCKDPLHRITAAEVMQHPWVSGSAWQVVLPDLSRSPDSRGGASSEGAEGTHHSSSAGLNAEELAAVVFPAMHGEAGPCGSSPRSAGDSRTHLVDALAAASIAAGEDDVALRLAHSPRSHLHKLAGDSMLKQAWGRSISGGTRNKPPASETVTEADDEATSGQIPSHESTPVEAARQQSWPQPGGEWGNAAPPAAAVRGGASAAPAPELAPLAANDSDAEESSSTGGGDVLDDMVLTMDGVRQAQPQQAQQQQQASGGVEQHKSSAPAGTQQPPAAAAFGTPEDGASWPSGSCRGAGVGERPAVEQQQDSCDFGSRSRAHSAGGGGGGGGSAPNLFRRSLRRLSAATSGEDGRERQQSLDQNMARSTPAAGAMGSVGSAFGGGGSAGKGLKARSIDTLRSMFVGPADFLLTDGSMAGHPLRQSPAAAARTGGLSAGLADAAEGAGEGGAGPRLPPRVPPTRPSREQPVVINTFRPGERMLVASGGQQQQACFYIEEGVAELRYEADVPVTLSSILAAAFPTSLFRRPASAAASSTPTAASGGPAHQRQPSSSSQPRSQQRGRRASQDASADPFDQALQAERLELPEGASSGNGEAATAAAAELGRTSSLAAVVEQATLRAEALLSNAKAGSVDHLLVSERTTSEFLGGLAMLDARIFMGRWKATAVARTHVVAMHMNREGLELFLQQNPLAQVHLRASMAKARAEVVKLEALEKIAVAHQRQHQLTQKLRSRRRLSGSVGSARVHRQPAVPPGTPALPGPLRGAPLTAEAAAGVAPADAAPDAVRLVGEPLAELSAVSTAAAAEAAAEEEEVSSARTPTTASSSSAASDQGDDSEGDDGLASALSAGISSSTLELFSMVSKLRQQIDSQLLHLIQQSGSHQYAVAPGADTQTP